VNWCAITSSSISWLVHPKRPTQQEKLHFIALAVAVTSPTKQQTEGTYRCKSYCPSMDIIAIKHWWNSLLHPYLYQAVYQTQWGHP